MTGEERARRVGLNEALFRELNEQLQLLAGGLLPSETPLDLICECARADCAARLRVSRGAYERIRSDPVLFFVRAGHVEEEVEDVVEETPAYQVVRKHEGTPAAIAAATDPRS